MSSSRQERSRLLDVTVSLAAGLAILAAVNVRTIWSWAREREQAIRGQTSLTESSLVQGAVDMADRWLRSLELHAYDQRLNLRAQYNPRRDDPKAAERLIFVEVDDNALLRQGRWPWPRELQATVLDTLKRLGARGVLTDVEYPERSAAPPGNEPPDQQLARALAKASLGTPARREVPDGAAFGVTFLSLHGSERERRAAHAHRNLLAWAVQARDAEPPAALRHELAATGSADPAKEAVRALAVARLVKDSPYITLSDALLTGTLPDLTPPAVPDELKAGATQHPALVLSACNSAVRANPDAPDAAIVEAVLGTFGVKLKASATPVQRRYATEYLPRLIGFCRDKQDALGQLGEELDAAREVMFEHWILEEKKRDPHVDRNALVKLIATRLKLRPDEHDLLAERVIMRRESRSLLWKRDLHAAPEGGLVDRLPVLGEMGPPIPEIAAAYRGIGISTVERDEGGVVRHQRLTFRVEPIPGDPAPARPRLAFHASVPVVAFLRDLDLDRAEAGADYLKLPAKHGGQDVVVPIDKHGRTIIDFRGKWGGDGFQRVSASSILRLAEAWRQRDQVCRLYADYRAMDDLRLALERLQVPLPVAVGAFDAAARAGLAAGLESWSGELRAKLSSLSRETLFKLALEERDLLDFLADAKQKGNAADAAEAEQALKERQYLAASLVTDLPAMEAELRRLVGGAFCLYGVTSTSTTDISATPLDPLYVNIGVHANLIDQMLRADYLFRPPWKRVDAWILFAYLAFIPLVLPAISIRKGLFATVGLVGFHMALSSLLMVGPGIWIDATTPVLSIVAAYTLITIRRYLMEERAKNQIRGMFQSYLDPRVVEAMLADESVYRDLGGTNREITAFFSDIEGFTTISELLDPDELSSMLQAYLTPMTDSILSHGGLRDKYIGDAIVAIFGAPKPSTDHAAQACLAAIQQLNRLTLLKQQWQEQQVGWYRKIREARLDLNFRIGLNTGRAKVGNFGAENAKNYTMIGDSVNLAARLEGANKAYKSRIMISETTYAGATDAIEARELDLLRVVGKAQPVKVYELLGRKGHVEPARVTMAAEFAEALKLYRNRRFDQARGAFADILRRNPDDAPTRVYLKRLDDTEFLASLTPDWDGAYSSKEK